MTSIKDTEPLCSRRSGRTVKIVIASAIAIIVVLTATYLRPRPELGGVDFLLDKNFGIPTPPHDTQYSALGNLIAPVFLCLLAATCAALGVRDFITRRTILPLMVAVSGVLGIFTEVFVDIMGAVYYPWIPEAVALKVLGREMPWWSLSIWFGYTSINYFTYRILESNPPTRALWQLWGVGILVNLLFEELYLNVFDKLYHYYGNQPLIVFSKLPLWWLPCNSVGIFLAAALAFRYKKNLDGWKSLLLFLLTPMSISAVYGCIAMPSWIVVNGDYPWLVTQMAGLLTIGLGVAAFCLILNLVLQRDPFDMDGRAGSPMNRGPEPG